MVGGFFFFKQKTAYEMRISDWSSDVCSSDLEVYHYITHADAYGLSVEKPSFDLGKIVERSRKVAGQLNAGVTGLMKKNKVTVVTGEGRIAAKGKLSVKQGAKTADLAAKNIILATGARARDLPTATPQVPLAGKEGSSTCRFQ